MMVFDREAPGGGVEVKCKRQNGKVCLEWKIHLSKERDIVTDMIRLRIVDNHRNIAVECVQNANEEEPLTSVVFQPKFWQGVDNPYLYDLEAEIFSNTGKLLDRLCKKLPLRDLEMRSVSPDRPKQLFLNGELFVPKVVKYSLFDVGLGAEGQARIYQDLQILSELGANFLCVEEVRSRQREWLLQLCEKMGFLMGEVSLEDKNKTPAHLKLCGETDEFTIVYEDKMPIFQGKEDALILPGQSRKTSLFYRYKAMWSKEPFVYIVPESVRRLASGNYQVKCYSNLDRLVFYSDGNFFESQNGSAEFVFWEVPVKGACIMISAEGNGCSTSFSVHKNFTVPSLIGDN